jgi:hypothetical protein
MPTVCTAAYCVQTWRTREAGERLASQTLELSKQYMIFVLSTQTTFAQGGHLRSKWDFVDGSLKLASGNREAYRASPIYLSAGRASPRGLVGLASGFSTGQLP